MFAAFWFDKAGDPVRVPDRGRPQLVPGPVPDDLLLSGAFRNALHSSDGVAYLTTVVTVLVLFGSLIVHELGHALVARREGIEVQRIDLFLFGGLTQMSRDAATPGEDFKIAAAGPLATFGVRAGVPGRRSGDRRTPPAWSTPPSSTATVRSRRCCCR